MWSRELFVSFIQSGSWPRAPRTDCWCARTVGPRRGSTWFTHYLPSSLRPGLLAMAPLTVCAIAISPLGKGFRATAPLRPSYAWVMFWFPSTSKTKQPLRAAQFIYLMAQYNFRKWLLVISRCKELGRSCTPLVFLITRVQNIASRRVCFLPSVRNNCSSGERPRRFVSARSLKISKGSMPIGSGSKNTLISARASAWIGIGQWLGLLQVLSR